MGPIFQNQKFQGSTRLEKSRGSSALSIKHISTTLGDLKRMHMDGWRRLLDVLSNLIHDTENLILTIDYKYHDKEAIEKLSISLLEVKEVHRKLLSGEPL
jgi:hypothetical protein